MEVMTRMKKEEFLRELEHLLSEISEEERADALAFYQSYFEDAGEENEASIMEELQSPQQVAESILRNLGCVQTVDYAGNTGAGDSAGSASNTGYYNTHESVNSGYTSENSGYTNASSGYANANYGSAGQNGSYMGGNVTNKKDKTVATVLLIVLAVITSPLWLSLLACIASALFGVVCIVFGVIVAVIAVMVALIVIGFVLAGSGISFLISGSVPVGIALLGAGLIVLGLGILAVVLVAWILGVFLPWMVKGIVQLCRKLFNKRKEHAAV